MITIWEKFDAEVQNIFVNTWTLLGKHWLDEHTTICQDGGVCKRYDQTLLPLYQLIICVLIVFSSSLANTDMTAKVQDDKRHMIYRLFMCRPRPSTPPHRIVVKVCLEEASPTTVVVDLARCSPAQGIVLVLLSNMCIVILYCHDTWLCFLELFISSC